MRYSFFFRNPRGLSLLQVIVIAGFVSMLALSSSQVAVTMARNQAVNKARSDFSTLVNIVGSALMGSSTCKNTFRVGTSTPTISSTASSTVTLSINGVNFGGGATYGKSLKNVVVTVAPVAGSAVVSSSNTLVQTTITVTAQRNIDNRGLSSSQVGALPSLTMLYSGTGTSGALMECNAVRINNSGSMNLAACGAGQVNTSSNGQLVCKNKAGLCPNGYVPNGLLITLNASGVVDPAQSPGNGCVQQPACCGTLSGSVCTPNSISSSLTGTTVTISQEPIQVIGTLNGQQNVITAIICGYKACPPSMFPVYGNSSYPTVATSCQAM